jgi:hypothetical protein
VTSTLIFVETSIHVHRFLAAPPEQEQLEAQLAALAPNLYTSHYVWMEFQRSLMADFAHIQQFSCWPLGDVIIALQTPPQASIWTRDPDFKPLALALGIDLYKN